MNNNGNRKECFHMSADVILTHFNQLFCPNDLGHPLYGKEMAEARILSDAYIAIKDGKILAVGTGQPDPELIDDQMCIRDSSDCSSDDQHVEN